MKNKLLMLGSLIYLWILGAAIGGIITCGIFVAPIIFNAYNFLPDLGITQYDSGILMAQVFLKFNSFLNLSAMMILIYELLAFNLSNKTSFFSLIIGAINVALIFLFTFYYTPNIIKAQTLGASATATPEFANLHLQSEWIFKALVIFLSIGFAYRIILFFGNKK